MKKKKNFGSGRAARTSELGGRREHETLTGVERMKANKATLFETMKKEGKPPENAGKEEKQRGKRDSRLDRQQR